MGWVVELWDGRLLCMFFGGGDDFLMNNFRECVIWLCGTSTIGKLWFTNV